MNILDNADHGSLSDLFFNHEHPVFNALFHPKANPTREEQRAAILKDATEFQNDFGGPGAQWYADDFMKRL